MAEKKVYDFIQEVKPVIDVRVRGLCVKPYYNHPKGCPNFGKKEGCPPHIKLFHQIFDMSKPIYVIYNAYDLSAHVERMRSAHPNWTYRQLICSRYWQGSARKQLREKIALFKSQCPEYDVTTCPEGMGVNVTETMKQIGIELEWPPKRLTYQVALAGIRIQNP